MISEGWYTFLVIGTAVFLILLVWFIVGTVEWWAHNNPAFEKEHEVSSRNISEEATEAQKQGN